MEGIPRIHASPEDEARAKLAGMFSDVERKARLTGRAEILLRLDRIPNLVLGPMNRVSEGAESVATAESIAALQAIVAELSQSQTNTK